MISQKSREQRLMSRKVNRASIVEQSVFDQFTENNMVMWLSWNITAQTMFFALVLHSERYETDAYLITACLLHYVLYLSNYLKVQQTISIEVHSRQSVLFFSFILQKKRIADIVLNSFNFKKVKCQFLCFFNEIVYSTETAGEF